MTTYGVDVIQRPGCPPILARASSPAVVHQVSTVINQPLTPVLAYLRSATNGKEGRTDESDPTMGARHVAWGWPVCVCYTVYEVPGGTQVTASIESRRDGRLDPIPVMAARAIRRRVASDMSTMRDALA